MFPSGDKFFNGKNESLIYRYSGRTSPGGSQMDKLGSRGSPPPALGTLHGRAGLSPSASAAQLDRYPASPPAAQLDKYPPPPPPQLEGRFGGGRSTPQQQQQHEGRSTPSTQLDKYPGPASRQASSLSEHRYGRDSPTVVAPPPPALLERFATPPAAPENSLIEPYVPPPQQQHAASPPQPGTATGSLELSRTPSEEPPPSSEAKSKSVSFEDEEQSSPAPVSLVVHPPPPAEKPERRVLSARERWHWAYSKIVMQLNVSTGSTRPSRHSAPVHSHASALSPQSTAVF
ncbi:uncharacterized protein LOC126305262 [Schistocerca gregaria]|uniref:uncharacterized protein LOC126305262 n=1 Tax=Schistocerca gregaria TaxID=7010 RepID=UPI00211F135E|nr:uncharacterized protein LOC126305262 [Schistocerca gregaria]